MRVINFCKYSYIIYLSIIILLAACTHYGATNNRRQVREQQNFQVYKIDSINSYYLIYAKRRDSLVKIVSKKEAFDGGTKILMNRKYPFTLESVWRAPLMINNVNVSPSQTPHVTCLGYDDSTTICLERDSINDLYDATNVRGLKFVRTVINMAK